MKSILLSKKANSFSVKLPDSVFLVQSEGADYNPKYGRPTYDSWSILVILLHFCCGTAREASDKKVKFPSKSYLNVDQEFYFFRKKIFSYSEGEGCRKIKNYILVLNLEKKKPKIVWL